MQNLLLVQSDLRLFLLNWPLQSLELLLLKIHIPLSRLSLQSPLLNKVETAFQLFLNGLHFHLQPLVNFDLLLSFRLDLQIFLLKILKIKVEFIKPFLEILILLCTFLNRPILILPILTFPEEFLAPEFHLPQLWG